MKNLLKSLTVSVGFCLSTGQLQAAQTNLLQYLNVRGAFIYQGLTVTNSTGTTVTKSTTRTPFGNADLIRRLGVLGGVDFSSAAKLVIIRQLHGSAVDIVVEDGLMRMDAGSYINIEFGDDPILETSSKRQDTGAVSATRYQLLRLTLNDTGNFGSLGMQFETEGLATIKRKTLFLDGTPHFVDRATATTLTGAGKSNNAGGGEREFLAQLTFTVTGGTVEVIE
jgi:hypothetical protein